METETPVFDTIEDMTLKSIERADLDPESLMLVRFAGLVAIGAPPGSYVANLAAAEQAGLTAEEIQAALVALLPIVGSPRVVTAVGNIARGLGIAIEPGGQDDGDADDMD
jgi:alkylhydroperoxidase/carboxymuconolactone decarboxylase family protein YurZ